MTLTHIALTATVCIAMYIGIATPSLAQTTDSSSTLNTIDEPAWGSTPVPGGTPLMAAVEQGDIDKVLALLHSGASPNEKGRSPQRAMDGTPLPLATCKGNYDLVKLLLENGANVNSVYEYNIYHEKVNSLEIAAANGHKGIVRILLQYKPTKYGIALDWACSSEIEQLLCDYFRWPKNSMGELESGCAKLQDPSRSSWDGCRLDASPDWNNMCK